MDFEGASTVLSVCTRYVICLCLCPSQQGNNKAVKISTRTFSDNIILSSEPGRKKELRSCWSKGVCFVCRYSYICMACRKSLPINREIAAFSSARPCRQVQTDTSKLCSHSELPRHCKLLSGRYRVMLMWHHAQNNIPCLSVVLISLGSCSYLASGLGLPVSDKLSALAELSCLSSLLYVHIPLCHYTLSLFVEKWTAKNHWLSSPSLTPKETFSLPRW